MAEGLSLAASIAGVLSLAIQVSNGLYDYYSSFKHRDETIMHLTSTIGHLNQVLNSLSQLLENRIFTSDEEVQLKEMIGSSIEDAKDIVDDLSKTLEKAKAAEAPVGLKSRLNTVGHRIAFPFRERTLKKLQEDVKDLEHEISLSLGALQLNDSTKIKNEVGNIKSIIEAMATTGLKWEIRDWLKAPDCTSNCNDAAVKRHESTNRWFVESATFRKWLKPGGPWIWINGFSGCGKSVLCSTAIESAFHQRDCTTRVGVAFYFFSFADQSKQDLSGLLKSLILQLSHQQDDQYKALRNLYGKTCPGSPSLFILEDVLISLIRDFNIIYILIDALDEVPVGDSRNKIFDMLAKLRDLDLQKVCILITSREERDIKIICQDLLMESISMRNHNIDEDISKYISGRLRQDRSLRKWSKHRSEIEKTLTEKANGMFRWVECQFRSLSRCSVSKHQLDTHLNSLPRDLDETYERMLEKINPEVKDDARRILLAVCFAERLLSVEELLQAVAVDLTSHQIDPDRLYNSIDDLLEICPGFLTVSLIQVWDESIPNFRHRVRIAHFSVQEYLVRKGFDQISNSCETKVNHFSEERAHAELVQVYLACSTTIYISFCDSILGRLSPHPFEYDDDYISERLSFDPFGYALQFWHIHLQKSRNVDENLYQLAVRSFSQFPGIFPRIYEDTRGRYYHSFPWTSQTVRHKPYYDRFQIPLIAAIFINDQDSLAKLLSQML